MEKKKFDWYEALKHAPHAGNLTRYLLSVEVNKAESHFDEGDNPYVYLDYLSGNWVTCACGQLCDVLPRRVDYPWGTTSRAPLDQKLFDLGDMFCIHVSALEWGEARRTLDEIESRSSKLLKELSDEKI